MTAASWLQLADPRDTHDATARSYTIHHPTTHLPIIDTVWLDRDMHDNVVTCWPCSALLLTIQGWLLLFVDEHTAERMID